LTLAQSCADDDPGEARLLLDEAIEQWSSLDYEEAGQLNTAVFTAARLGAWPTALQAASRVLHHQLRSGVLSVMNCAGMMNLVARGLADRSLEPAAVIQGAVARLIENFSTEVSVAPSAGSSRAGGLVAFTTAVRREATGSSPLAWAVNGCASFAREVKRWRATRRIATRARTSATTSPPSKSDVNENTAIDHVLPTPSGTSGFTVVP
jgi:hypothetical protein